MAKVRLARDLTLALDRRKFAAACGLPSLDPWQLELLESHESRVLACCSRQSGKSTIGALIALHVALYERELALIVSASDRQAREVLKKSTSFLRALGEDAPDPERETLSELELAGGGRLVSLPASEGTIRGYSAAKFVLIDEASRVADEVVAALSPARATRPESCLWAFSTPAGRRGWFSERWHNSHFQRIMVTADDVPRISKAFLAEERELLGEQLFNQEYYCRFVVSGAFAFTWDQIDGLFSDDVEPLFRRAA